MDTKTDLPTTPDTVDDKRDDLTPVERKMTPSFFAPTPPAEPVTVATIASAPPVRPTAPGGLKETPAPSSSGEAPAEAAPKAPTVEIFDPRTGETRVVTDETTAETVRTAEEWLAVKKTKRWDFDLARGLHAWAQGKELTEQEYDDAIARGGKVSLS